MEPGCWHKDPSGARHCHASVTAEPVLADKFTADLPVTRVWVGSVADPKGTSSLLRALHGVFPLPSLAHCKRVSRSNPGGAGGGGGGGCGGGGGGGGGAASAEARDDVNGESSSGDNGSVLRGSRKERAKKSRKGAHGASDCGSPPASASAASSHHAHPTALLVILFEEEAAVDRASALALLNSNGLHEAVQDPRLVDVPAAKPITREQYTVAAALWPVLFHEDKRVARALGGELLSADELRVRVHGAPCRVYVHLTTFA
jgi:hypothetical protein